MEKKKHLDENLASDMNRNSSNVVQVVKILRNNIQPHTQNNKQFSASCLELVLN